MERQRFSMEPQKLVRLDINNKISRRPFQTENGWIIWQNGTNGAVKESSLHIQNEHAKEKRLIFYPSLWFLLCGWGGEEESLYKVRFNHIIL